MGIRTWPLVDGLDAAIDRACRYVEAEADMIFAEALSLPLISLLNHSCLPPRRFLSRGLTRPYWRRKIHASAACILLASFHRRFIIFVRPLRPLRRVPSLGGARCTGSVFSATNKRLPSPFHSFLTAPQRWLEIPQER